jgi:hypothetical protein
MLALLSAHAEQLLAGLQENQLLNRLRYQIGLRLGRERCDLAACAQAMDLTAATLQRALLPQGQAFAPCASRGSACAVPSYWRRAGRRGRWHGPAVLPSCRRFTGPFAAAMGRRRSSIEGARWRTRNKRY